MGAYIGTPSGPGTMIPGGAVGYGSACGTGCCSADGFLLTFALEFDFAGEDVVPFLFRVFWLARFVELLDLLLALAVVLALAGVGGGEARADAGAGVGSGCWRFLRCKASISSSDKFTFVLPFALARAILAKADWINTSSFSRTAI
jgi:hypothetical protein